MAGTMMMYSELSFNLVYLVLIWILVIKMYLNRSVTSAANKTIAKYFMYAFLLLAIGDTGHVGFRVLAYSMGGLETKIDVFGYALPLVGAGALSTAITITFFYMYIVAIWHEKFYPKKNFIYILLQFIGLVRLFIMAFPQNKWANVVPPVEWSQYRNLPLIIVGFSILILILLSNKKTKDPFYNKLGLLILASFLFYLPVIFWIQQIPLLGMLMIPKTIAYLGIGFIAYKEFFSEE